MSFTHCHGIWCVSSRYARALIIKNNQNLSTQIKLEMRHETGNVVLRPAMGTVFEPILQYPSRLDDCYLTFGVVFHPAIIFQVSNSRWQSLLNKLFFTRRKFPVRVSFIRAGVFTLFRSTGSKKQYRQYRKSVYAGGSICSICGQLYSDLQRALLNLSRFVY